MQLMCQPLRHERFGEDSPPVTVFSRLSVGGGTDSGTSGAPGLILAPPAHAPTDLLFASLDELWPVPFAATTAFPRNGESSSRL